jgi:biopolymer transport protein ExbB
MGTPADRTDVGVGRSRCHGVVALRLWRSRHELSIATRVVAVVAASAAMLGALGTLLGLIKVFGAVGGESVDPSQQARILGEGIAEAMNSTALALIGWVLSVITLVLVRAKRAPAK